MAYKVTLLDFAEKDFEKLDGSIQLRANRQLEKLPEAPELGDDLGSKFGVNPGGYKALHFYKNQYRIVYRVVEDKKEVEVWGIGKRDGEKIYRLVSNRTEKNHL